MLAFGKRSSTFTHLHQILVNVKHIGRFYAILILGLFMALPGQAQDFAQLDNTINTGMSYHVFAKPGEVTVRILVLGEAGGIYDVGESTQVDEFLALIGGAPGFGVRSSQNRTKVTIQLYRDEGIRRRLVYEAPMEEMFQEPGQYPDLQDGDIFVVEVIEKSRISWRDVLSVVTSISSLVLLIVRLSEIS